MKANMAQQQDMDLSCELACDEVFTSSPPVSFYQLLEEETVPSEVSTVKHHGAVDDSYVLPGNLRSQLVQDYSNPQMSMTHSVPITVPNQHDISSDTCCQVVLWSHQIAVFQNIYLDFQKLSVFFPT
jgi:hypothetical protein